MGRLVRRLLITAALLCWAGAGMARTAEVQAKLAIVGFRFLDTSGEPQDRTARHAARVQAMTEQIGAELATNGRFRIIDLPAAGEASSEPAAAVAAAREAGADLALFGAVQKLSSLVLWAQASIVDTGTGESRLERLLSFRGDTDEAFQRAGSFLARQIAEALPPRP